ncbi:MAG: hypothetical protein ACPHCV_00600 [Pseudohongiellaceae bacterium]
MAEPTQLAIETLRQNPDTADAFAQKFGESALAKYMPEGSYAAGVARSVGQGLTFGFADELTAGAKALFGKGSYSELVEEERRALHQFREQNPEAYAYEIASAFAIPGLGLIKGTTTAAKTARAIAGSGPTTGLRATTRGAVEGALYGAGASDARNPAELALGAGIGGVAGAPLGYVGKKAGDAVGNLMRRGPALSQADQAAVPAATKVIQKAMTDVGPGQAGRLAAEGMPPTEAYRATLGQMGPDATIADAMGSPGESLLRGVSQGSSDARDIITDPLRKRAEREYDRLVSEGERLLDAKVSANYFAREIDSQAEEAAEKLYREAALATTPGSVIDNAQVSSLFRKQPDYDYSPDFRKAYNKAKDEARRAGIDMGRDFDDFINKEQYSIAELKLLVQGFKPMIETAKKVKFNAKEYASLTQIRNALQDRLKEINPTYAEANEVREIGYRTLEAVDLGREIVKRDSQKFDDDILDEFLKNVKHPNELMGLRSGALFAISQLGDNAKTSLATRIKKSRTLQRRLEKLFSTPESYQEFLNTLGTQEKFRKTLDVVQAGSQTQRAGADIADVFGDDLLPDLATAASGVATPNLVARGGQFILDNVRKIRNEKLAKELATMIALPEPGLALQKLDQIERIYKNLSFSDRAIINQIRRGLSSGLAKAPGGFINEQLNMP